MYVPTYVCTSHTYCTLSLEPLQQLESELANSRQESSERSAQVEQKDAEGKVGRVFLSVHVNGMQ